MIENVGWKQNVIDVQNLEGAGIARIGEYSDVVELLEPNP
jgi:hypothetical protein